MPTRWKCLNGKNIASFTLGMSLLWFVGCTTPTPSPQPPSSTSLPAPARVQPAQPEPSIEEPLPKLPDKNRKLAKTYSSTEELTKAFLKALADKPNAKVLLSFAVTKDEYCQYLVPELPGGKIPNVNCDFLWNQDQIPSSYGLQSTLSNYSGKKYTFVSLSFTKKPETYETYRIYRFPRVKVLTETNTEEVIIPFGPVVEIDGEFKLYGFGKDD
ncbi:MAG: hypothetical protein HY774_19255 [Acidobacteria bacterium]|nr:hypothetical protein [Acidobacteriota bacterium]